VYAVTGVSPPTVHVVGGGASHTLLCQLTADATGLPVYAGPTEATALGNAAVQLVTLGELGGLADIRAVVAAATEPTEYLPRSGQDWAAAVTRLDELIQADQRQADQRQADHKQAGDQRAEHDSLHHTQTQHAQPPRSKTG
jgi:rhamnulokinase